MLGIRNNIRRDRKLIYKGWDLDFKRFYIYLKDKYKITKAIIFMER